jgi:DNA-binding GntR family transcriptional regulator
MSERAQPRYAALADALRADIAAARMRPGDPLPTEAQLTARFGVSRFTVREALRTLASEGLIERKRGSGTVVAATRPALRQALSETRALLQYAAASSFRISPAVAITLRPAQAAMLQRPAGEPWLHIRGVRVMDGAAEPVAVTDAFLHPRFAAIADRLESGHEALFAQLERLSDVRIGRVTQEIQAVNATAAEAEALAIPKGAACLRIIRHYFDTGADLVEMSCSVHPGTRFSYMVDTSG